MGHPFSDSCSILVMCSCLFEASRLGVHCWKWAVNNENNKNITTVSPDSNSKIMWKNYIPTRFTRVWGSPTPIPGSVLCSFTAANLNDKRFMPIGKKELFSHIPSTYFETVSIKRKCWLYECIQCSLKKPKQVPNTGSPVHSYGSTVNPTWVENLGLDTVWKPVLLCMLSSK